MLALQKRTSRGGPGRGSKETFDLRWSSQTRDQPNRGDCLSHTRSFSSLELQRCGEWHPMERMPPVHPIRRWIRNRKVNPLLKTALEHSAALQRLRALAGCTACICAFFNRTVSVPVHARALITAAVHNLSGLLQSLERFDQFAFSILLRSLHGE
jgi:hypothetical protein